MYKCNPNSVEALFSTPGGFLKSFRAYVGRETEASTVYITSQWALFRVREDNSIEYICGTRYPADTIRFWIEGGDIPMVDGVFTLQWVEGVGYSGGHVSQAGFETWEPEEDDKSLSISTTHSGRCTGYYPGRYYIRVKK